MAKAMVAVFKVTIFKGESNMTRLPKTMSMTRKMKLPAPIPLFMAIRINAAKSSKSPEIFALDGLFLSQSSNLESPARTAFREELYPAKKPKNAKSALVVIMVASYFSGSPKAPT